MGKRAFLLAVNRIFQTSPELISKIRRDVEIDFDIKEFKGFDSRRGN
ncbi:MAG: hypothetical protein ACK518_01960 [bacterium]